MMATQYGEIDLTRSDIRERPAWSLDLRDLSGGDNRDETHVCEAGTFTLSVVAHTADEIPIGEIRIVWEGIEVSVVGHPTGRAGVVEVTPEHLQAARDQGTYRAQLLAWMGGGSC